MSFLSSNLPNAAKNPRQIFVAYPYKLYDKKDYRKAYQEAEKAFSVHFVFADEKITDLHILQKIQNYIRESRFSIFDITGWNANVTLELGLALGLTERTFIIFNPSKIDVNEVPSDLRGVDRMHYSSFTDLGENLSRLLEQEFPIVREHPMESQIELLGSEMVKILEAQEGLRIGDIARGLGISVELAKLVIKPLVNRRVEMRGVKKGAKYYLLEQKG
ncbi:hypothetical protein [Prosthecomicrobium pneumaticum]|uniref:Putative nucleotide-binding protein n=1 Tax=Prosthecomicrobium pneumaticum TaxID=81895 RepID=A0A7W9FK92_9HYPH|nr:hypothetical protein [Prosthecomicrobium pneumaticum]MBB5752532.1 putative nucleotide-binding protein [Prosthecomicrobium pneumaticum]